MNTFKITYDNGDTIVTQANGSLEEFTAYLMQFGGVDVKENPVTGEETKRKIATIEPVQNGVNIYKIVKVAGGYRAHIRADNGKDWYATWKAGTDIQFLVQVIEQGETPKPEIVFEPLAAADFYRTLPEDIAALAEQTKR